MPISRKLESWTFEIKMLQIPHDVKIRLKYEPKEELPENFPIEIPNDQKKFLFLNIYISYFLFFFF